MADGTHMAVGVLGGGVGHRVLLLAVDLSGEVEHDAGADDAPHHGAQQAHQHRHYKGFPGAGGEAYHICTHDQPHAEGGSQVGQGGELVALEEALKVVVLGQGEDGRVVGEERGHHAHRRRSRQAEEGHHQGVEQAVHERDHPKLGEQGGDGSHQHADGHQIEYSVNEQGVGGVHHGVEGVHQAHLHGKDGEEGHKESDEHEIFRADLLFLRRLDWGGFWIHRGDPFLPLLKISTKMAGAILANLDGFVKLGFIIER